MKRLVSIVLILFVLLTGCAAEVPETTGTIAQQTTNGTVAATLPGLYEPDSAVEQQTDGSVRAYLPHADCTMVMMGETPLLFCWDGNVTTTLMRLTGELYYPGASTQVPGDVYPEDNGVCITARSVCYYDAAEKCIVFLNEKLQETRRISMPEDLVEVPVMCEDLSEAYYCTATELRALNTETGLSRLIRQHDGETVYIRSVCMNGTMLECYVVNGTESYTEFVSTENGQSLGIDAELLSFDAWKDRFCLQRMDGVVTETLFGTMDGTLQSFVPEEENATLYSLLEMDGVLEACSDETGVSLAFYKLSTGSKISKVHIDGLQYIANVVADPMNEAVWFLSFDYETDRQVLYRWELNTSAVTDDKVYTTARFTRENPDAAGLALCRKKADVLETQYGVEIFLEQELTSPWDYDFEYEYQVKAYEVGLTALENALALFPDGFFKTVAQVTDNGKIQIGLVRGMMSSTQDAPSDIVGLQYWLNGDAYIALTAGYGVERSFYHELCHVLDTFVYARTGAYDDWEKLNPQGFQYDGNYLDYQTRTDNSYIEGENRAFVDFYSMTYAKEDRARILEYAMEEGNEDTFGSEIMQTKLRQLCLGIREAFGWEKDSRSFLWEQYLKEPLAYTE